MAPRVRAMASWSGVTVPRAWCRSLNVVARAVMYLVVKPMVHEATSIDTHHNRIETSARGTPTLLVCLLPAGCCVRLRCVAEV